MKLTTVLLLVTLMLCCYSAADACPLLTEIYTKFLFATHDEYMNAIAPFATTPSMRRSASMMKQCAAGLSVEDRLANAELMRNIMTKCAA
ncbi:secretoglobin family 1D member 2-like [Elgaria multicarinata webbii]|uniref:secretoglobin family 1D member 2-like n=1 Tax=Elgaria multicarinata webbii TaxID=159646 RepID=UPI002FCCC4FF